MDFSKNFFAAMDDLFIGTEVRDEGVETNGINALGGGLEPNDEFVGGSFKDFL